MTLQEIWDHLDSRINKDQSGNTYNPQRFNADLNSANIEMFNIIYNPRTNSLPNTTKIKDDLRDFLINMGGSGPNDPGPLSVDSNGIALLPSDYLHVTAMNYSYVKGNCNQDVKYPKFDILTDQQWSDAINSVTRNYRVAEFPYCVFRDGYIEVRPKNVQFINFVYFRYPITPYYDYYVTADDDLVYLPPGTVYNLQPGETGSAGQTNIQVQSQSVELEYPVELHPDFANLLLGYVADNLRSNELKQSAELRKQQGY